MAKRKAATAKSSLTLKHSAARGTAVTESTQNVAVTTEPTDAVRQKIAEAAYFRAEKRGFASGCDVDDWLAAEAEITGCGWQQRAPDAELH